MWPLLRLSETWALPTYLVVTSLTYCLCLYALYTQARREGRSTALTLDLGLALMVGGFSGARLFHVIYEEPVYY
jgi:prolipoprotein diacylglyceryltransferase